MRYAILCAILLLAAPAQAAVCLGTPDELTIFLPDGAAPPEAEFITGVVIETVKNNDAVAVISYVTKAPPNTIKTGDRVKLEYVITACGPNLRAMDKGTIVARRGVDADQRISLQPYILTQAGNPVGVAQE